MDLDDFTPSRPFFPGMPSLTGEQQAVVGCDLAPGQVLKVLAFAGTGKTATLVAYAAARPHLRFLYLAFNKSVQIEAAKRFPANVTARTAHALAFRTHGARHKARLVPGFRANTVMAALGLEQYEDARFAMATLANYLVSADPKVARRHIPHSAGKFYERKKSVAANLVDLANRLGRLMCDGSDERIGMLHDGYLKLYQLSRPHLPYDCILLDEAQDINPVISALVLAQAGPSAGPKPAALVLVGDSHQQIYSFRGAKDSLARIASTRTLCLTRSFRFDNNVARVANMVLETFKGEKRKLVGTPVAKGAKPPWDRNRYTVIARTNAAIFARAAALVGTRRIGFAGGADGYRFHAVRDLYFLFSEKRERIADAYLKSFGSYGELKRYAKAVEDVELMSLCKVVEAHGAKIPGLVKQITATAVDAGCAEVVLTTAHKAKGLEWDFVLIAEDFLPLVKDGELIDPARVDPDELNLIYVAMTRAACRLRFDRKSRLPEFVRLVRSRRQKVKST